MKFHVGITDEGWVKTLKATNTTCANYWKPGSKKGFKVLQSGDLFLFKSHASAGGKIVGCGSFVKYERLSVNKAWRTYGDMNGCASMLEMKMSVERYRKNYGLDDTSSSIGCIILSDLVFFEEAEWIASPADWKRGSFPGKTYYTDDKVGLALYADVCKRLRRIAQTGLLALSLMSRFSGIDNHS